MNSKKIRRTVVASVATVAGIFGGMKLYANRKKRLAETLEEPQKIAEPENKEKES